MLSYDGFMYDTADYQWERDNILAEIAGYDPTYEIVHHAAWSDYEENGWMFILRKDSQLYLLTWAYSVMADDNTPKWYPIPISESEALKEMIEWEQHEDLPEPPPGPLQPF
jgi:hypothetical protein